MFQALTQRATGVFRAATECGCGPTKGSESPLATEGKALCKWITPIPLRPYKGLIIMDGVGIIDRGKPLS